jgi:hypothetical protein
MSANERARPRYHWPCVAAGCALLGACLLLASSLLRNRRADFRPPIPSHARAALSDRPVRVEPRLSLPEALDSAAADRALSRLRRDHPGSLGDALHAMRLFGPAEPIHWGSQRNRASLLDVVLDPLVGADLLGAPALIDARTGVRCRVYQRSDPRKQKDRQAHEDQLLSVLAETGVPLSQPLSTTSGRQTVQRILDDALAKFDLKQDEIEWSALAFALYLPPLTRWSDKFGRVYSFDDLAEEMMSRKLDGRACAGCHILYSLAVILRADEQFSILSRPVRVRVKSYLGEMASAALRHQAADGSWGIDWRRDPKAAAEETDRSSARVLATGHLVEWMVILPDDLSPPRNRILVAAHWLAHHLSTANDQELAGDYCPYSHAGRVVQMGSRSKRAIDNTRADSGAPRKSQAPTAQHVVRANVQGGILVAVEEALDGRVPALPAPAGSDHGPSKP